MKPFDYAARELATSCVKDILRGPDGQGLHDFVVRAFPSVFQKSALDWSEADQDRWINRQLVDLYEKLYRECVKPALRKPFGFFDDYSEDWELARNDNATLQRLRTDPDLRNALVMDLLRLIDPSSVAESINIEVVESLRVPKPDTMRRDDFMSADPHLHHNPVIDAFEVAEWSISQMRRNGKAPPAVQQWFIGMYERLICGLGSLIKPTGNRLEHLEANDDRRTDADQIADFGNLLGMRLDSTDNVARQLREDPDAAAHVWADAYAADLKEPEGLLEGIKDTNLEDKYAFWAINDRLTMHNVLRRINRHELRVVMENETVRITNLAGKNEPSKYVGLLECLIMMHFRAYSTV